MEHNFEKQDNYNLTEEVSKEFLYNKAQDTLYYELLDDCPGVLRGDFDAYQNMTPDERIKIFKELRARKIGLAQVSTDSPEDLVGSSDTQDELKQTLLSNGYKSVDFLDNADDNVRIHINPIKDVSDTYLFGYERVLWECNKGDGRPSYVIKGSHFIAGPEFMKELDIDPVFLYLSTEKKEECGKLLSDKTKNSLIIPHSVLYTIKSEYPNGDHVYTKNEIKNILGMIKNQKNTSNAQTEKHEQQSQSSEGVLWIDGDID